MDVAEIITKKLEQRGWSQNHLAEKSGIAQPQVNRIVRGLNPNVTLATLRSLAKAFNCSTVDLLPDEDKPRRSQQATKMCLKIVTKT